MKKYAQKWLLARLLVMVASVQAENMQKSNPMPQHSKAMSMPHNMGSCMGMMSGMTEEQKDQHLRSMQEHMLKMHELSNQILAEKDAAKKDQLKIQQLELMKAHHNQMMGHCSK
jgi:hypothetical protein